MVVFVEHVALGRGFRFCSDPFFEGRLAVDVDKGFPHRGIGVFAAGGAYLAWLEITREHVFVVIPQALIGRWFAVASHSCSPS